VMPGPGKSFDAFQADQATCKSYAADQVRGQAEAANNQAVGAAVLTTAIGTGLGAVAGSLSGNVGSGAAVGAVAGAGVGAGIGAGNSQGAQYTIQQQYDNAFAQCMYSKHDQVPGFTPSAAAAPEPMAGGYDPAVVRGVQRELIRLNYLHDTADGAFGPKTGNAIRGYEAATGLPVDGVPSTMLLGKLQATPSSAAAASGAAPANWVAPAPSGSAAPGSAIPASATATAPAGSTGWVAPAQPGAPAAPAPAAGSGWVPPAAAPQ